MVWEVPVILLIANLRATSIHDRGVLSMAHAGRNTGGSQFFICHGRQNTQHLDRQHTCFGKFMKD